VQKKFNNVLMFPNLNI